MNKKRLAFAGKRDKQTKPQPLEEQNSNVLFAMNSPSQKNEHQSYEREANILPLKSGKNPQQLKKRKVIRSIVVASISAIIIGSLLGLVMLNMFANLEENAVNSVSSIDSIQKTDDAETNTIGSGNTEQTTITLEAIHGFVLQAGVFSAKENADAWSSSFVNNGFPTIVWERDQQFFLLAGIAQTRENAKEIATEFEQYNLEVFIKEWHTPRVELQVTPQEKEWLESLTALWESSLTLITAEESLDVKGWKSLVSSVPESNDIFASVKNTISENIPDGEQLSQSDAIKLLLSIWQAFEELGNEIE